VLQIQCSIIKSYFSSIIGCVRVVDCERFSGGNVLVKLTKTVYDH